MPTNGAPLSLGTGLGSGSSCSGAAAHTGARAGSCGFVLGWVLLCVQCRSRLRRHAALLTVPGSLWALWSSGPQNLNLPALRTITKRLYLYSAITVSLDIRALVAAGDITVYRGSLRSFSAPALRSVTGKMYFYNHGDLKSISMPKLEAVQAGFTARSLSQLEALAAPALRFIGGALNIDSDPKLLTLSGFSKLTTIRAEVTISSNAKLGCIKGKSPPLWRA